MSALKWICGNLLRRHHVNGTFPGDLIFAEHENALKHFLSHMIDLVRQGVIVTNKRLVNTQQSEQQEGKHPSAIFPL